MAQEPWELERIRIYLEDKYKVSFPVFAKIEVNGPNTHPIYRYLRNNSELFNTKTKKTKQIPWNFSKFLLN